jgi:gamma-glutamylcyclotransferase (GGCT)/AIG2-like uncharacterized protein YtfP
MTRHCFTYGSLMCVDIMARVCGAAVAGEPARLTHYTRHPVRDEEYPGVLPEAGGEVAGVLYRDLDDVAWTRLDAFEGEMYERRAVRVGVADGRREEAWVYVIRPEFSSRLGPGDWDFEAFLRQGKKRFEARYLGFDALDS